MKVVKTIVEFVFYVALAIVFGITLNLLLKDRTSIMNWFLFISSVVVFIHQVIDDIKLLTLLKNKSLRKKY